MDLRLLLIATLFFASGCASLVGEQTQPVSVDAPDCKKAKCRLTNSQGTYFVASTPGSVVINKAYGDLTITCEKNGKTATSTHASSANAATYGNILLGGGIGALVDGGSGAGYDYQSYLINGLKCDDITPSSAVKKSSLEDAKTKCASIGFKAGTDKFGGCVLKLMGK